jgi:hypothetical protein
VGVGDDSTPVAAGRPFVRAAAAEIGDAGSRAAPATGWAVRAVDGAAPAALPAGGASMPTEPGQKGYWQTRAALAGVRVEVRPTPRSPSRPGPARPADRALSFCLPARRGRGWLGGVASVAWQRPGLGAYMTPHASWPGPGQHGARARAHAHARTQ